MDVHAVIGDEGVKTTTTAVNLAVALRQDGHHAAVPDLAGDVTALLGGPAGSWSARWSSTRERKSTPRRCASEPGRR